MPGGFWEKYENKFIVKNESDQGPYGGHRTIHWTAKEKGTFDEKRILDFAISKEWYPTDTMRFSKSDIMDWYSDKIPVFPIYFKGTYKMYSEDDLSAFTAFKRLITDDLTVYRFKTNWLLIYPGSNESTAENGYILIDKDGKQMTLYQMWGE